MFAGHKGDTDGRPRAADWRPLIQAKTRYPISTGLIVVAHVMTRRETGAIWWQRIGQQSGLMRDKLREGDLMERTITFTSHTLG
jgi:hypothetical protein